MAAIFTVPTIFTAVDQITAPVRSMERNVNNFAYSTINSMKRASMSVTNFERNLTGRVKGMLGKLGQLGAGFSLFLLGSSIVNANIELDNSLQSLQAVTGVTGKEFINFTKKIDEVSASQKTFAGDTAKVFEIVGSNIPALLKNADALGKVSEASIILSKAGLMTTEDAANSVTGALNQFGLGSEHAARVANLLAAGAKEGSASIKLMSESMDKVGAVANSSNMSIEQTGAAIQLLSAYNLKGSEAGISLKATILNLKAAQLGFKSGQFDLNDALLEYNQRIENISDPIKKAAYQENVFKKEHILTGQILSANIDKLEELTKATTDTNEVTIQANINNMSLGILLKQIGDSFKNNITTTDSQNKSMNSLKNTLKFVADNMTTIISTAITLIKLFIIYKASVFLLNTALGIYNVTLGIQGALQNTAYVAIGRSTTALTAYKIATSLVTAAQWLYNTALLPAIVSTWAFATALWATGIPAIVLAIAALVAGIILLVKNWENIVKWIKESDNWFAKLIRFSLIPIITLFNAIKTAWTSIRDAFKGGGILEGLKQIGKSLLSFLLAPLEAILTAVSSITGGKIGGETLSKLKEFRAGLDTPNVVKSEVVTRNDNKNESKQNNNRVDLYLNNRSKDTEIYTEGTGINVNTTGYGK